MLEWFGAGSATRRFIFAKFTFRTEPMITDRIAAAQAFFGETLREEAKTTQRRGSANMLLYKEFMRAARPYADTMMAGIGRVVVQLFYKRRCGRAAWRRLQGRDRAGAAFGMAEVRHRNFRIAGAPRGG
jgi:hypothetical protein